MESFSSVNYAGIDELCLSVDFVFMNGDENEGNIKVFGQSEGNCTLRVRRHGSIDEGNISPVVDGDGDVIFDRTDQM